MVKVLNHALIKHKLSIMREEKTSNYIFKQNLDEIAMLMAYEVTKDYITGKGLRNTSKTTPKKKKKRRKK